MSRKKRLTHYYKELGPRIRARREELNMSEADLAEKVNVTPEYIGKLERGEAGPSYELFVDIANKLDVSEDVLSMGHPGTNPKFAMNNELAKQTDGADREDIQFYLDVVEAHKKYKESRKGKDEAD